MLYCTYRSWSHNLIKLIYACIHVDEGSSIRHQLSMCVYVWVGGCVLTCRRKKIILIKSFFPVCSCAVDVCACVRVCVRACVHACVYVCM